MALIVSEVRSSGAYLKDEMIGYMKIVWDTRSAAIMQISFEDGVS